jgi:hypothetical protein
MISKIDCKIHLNAILIHFICAGSSALILSLAYAFTDFWFFYIFALAPFMLRVANSDWCGSAFAALFLGLSLALILYPGNSGRSVYGYFGDVLFLCFTFVFFSVALNRLRRFFKPGFFLAILLCFPLEYFHKTVLDLDRTFLALKWDSGFIFRTASLSGFVFGAFLLIALNSFLLLFIEIIFGLRYCCGFNHYFEKIIHVYDARDPLPSVAGCVLPGLRGPPYFSR